MQKTIFAVLIVLLSVTVPSTIVNAQTIDPQFRADIERLMDLTGQASIGAQMASLVLRNVLDGMKRAKPDIPDRVIAITTEVLNAEFSKAFAAPDGINGQIVDLYARHFTHDDVSAMLAFYSTPVGRKTVSVMPLLMQEGAAVGQKWAQANMPRIMGVLADRLRAEQQIK